MNVKYSVIIPIYNAEKTLRRCIDSLYSPLQMSVQEKLMPIFSDAIFQKTINAP